jgi:methionine sulfoxide reductase heme-binding subunit
MTGLAGAHPFPWLWLVSRASGLVLLVCLSAVFVLGVATRRGSAPAAWPRFAVAELHRTLSLFAVAFLGLHVLTALVDPFVSIGWWATIVPFVSHYRAVAVGLGTLAVDVGAAVLVTSLLRARLGWRSWRAVHWLAYLALPAAFLHAWTAGGDLGIWWVTATLWASAGAVAVAAVTRVLDRIRPERPARIRTREACSDDQMAGAR